MRKAALFLLPVVLLGCYRSRDYQVDPGTVLQFGAHPASAPADGATLVTIKVTCPDVVGYPNAGTAAAFTTTLGKLLPASGPVPFDATGTATCQLQSPSQTGTAILQASVVVGGSTYAATQTLDYVPALPEAIVVAPSALNLVALTASTTTPPAPVTLALQTQRAMGTVTPGQLLTLTAVDSTGAPIGLIADPQVYTNATGGASTVFALGLTSYLGPITITATAAGTTVTGTVTLDVVN